MKDHDEQTALVDDLDSCVLAYMARQHSEDPLLDWLVRPDGIDGRMSAVRLFRTLRRGTPVEGLQVIAWPGDVPEGSLRAGDLLLRVGLGEPRLGHVAVLVDGRLEHADVLAAAGFQLEGPRRGMYAHVIDAGAFPHARLARFARRVLDASGCVPPGQLLLRSSLINRPADVEPWSAEDYVKGRLEHEISTASYRRLVYSFSLGKVYARFEGTAKFSVETTEPAKVEITLGKEAAIQINDLVFGANGVFKVSGDKVEFGLGTDDFSITFEPFSLNPISIHLPVVRHTLALEKDLPKLKLKGSVKLELEFTVDFIPDYVRLAKVVNKKNLKAFLQAGKSTLYKLGGKVATRARLVVKAGRAALIAPLKMIGNSIGRRLAWNSIKLGSQTAALRRLAGSVGKLLGAAGILLETHLIVKAAIPGALASVNKKVLEAIIPTFANSYGDFLALMTDDKAPLDEKFFERSLKIKRITAPPPDLYAVVEHLSQTGKVTTPGQDASKWVAAQIKQGITFKEENLNLAETDWRVLFREAYNLYFLFMDAAQNASDKTRKSESWKAIRGAHALVQDAGLIAAYQDVFTFATTSSLYQDSAGQSPQDVWEEWKNVRSFHQTVFGRDFAARQAYYVSLIDHSTLTFQIPPFTDYD